MLLLLALVLLAPTDRTVISERHQVRIDAPLGWTVLKQTAYPSVVAIMTHREGGRLTLSAQKTRPGETVEALVASNRPALEQQGVVIDRVAPSSAGEGVTELTGHSRNGRIALRQIYGIRGSWGFVLTLSGPPSKMTQFAHDLELAWHSLRP
jgi:hypothetical protein